MARAPRVVLSAFVTLIALLALAPSATASHIAAGPDGVSLDTANKRILYIARDGELNTITVTATATDYVFTESGTKEDFSPIPPVANAAGSGCTVATNVATCSKAGVESIGVFGAAETGILAIAQDTITVDANPPKGTILDGGAGNDDINGSPGDDAIFGREGIDVIAGNNGNDSITTGRSLEDFDRFQQANGGAGFDEIRYDDRPGPGGIFIDFSITPFAKDSDLDACPTFEGCSDILFPDLEKFVGTQQADEMIGGLMNETLVGLRGNDILCGGLGVDTIDYSGSSSGVNVTLDGVLDTDPRHALPLSDGVNYIEFRKARRDCREIVKTTGAPIPLSAGGLRDCTPNDGVRTGADAEHDCVGEDVENIIGSQFDDNLVGNSPDALEGQGPRLEPHGINDIEGRGGDDVIDGRFGPDALSGGDGNEVLGDTVTYATRVEPVSAAIDGAPNDGTVTANFLVGDYDPRSKLSDSLEGDVENVIGGPNDDILRGNGARNRLQGAGGNDYVDGGGGDDTLEGQSGIDSIVGGFGDDAMSGGPGDDTLDGEAGTDGVNGDADNDTIKGGPGADVLSGGKDTDTLDYSDANTSVNVTPDGAANDGTDGDRDNVAADFEMVLGGIGNDTLVGTASSNLLDGGAGDDALDGQGGSDELVGGAGMDVASYASRSAPVFVDLAAPGGDGEADENDNIRDDVEKVIGGSGDDTLLGNGRDNVLDGGPGNDRLAGAEGDDLLNGSLGADSLAGDVGHDTLFGSEGNDSLAGGDGNDDLKGEGGDDSVDGGAGSDRLIGGPGLDRVLYSARSGSVTVNLNGVDKNGERNENDFINDDVENVTTGSGGDTIDTADHKQGDVRCGAGADVVTADTDDRVAGDCENVQVSALGTRCTASSSAVRMSGSAIPVRVFCAVDAKGTLRLESVSRVHVGKSRKILKIGNKSFSLKAGQRKTISVKASKSALRLIKRNKRLSVRARISAKARVGKASTLKSSSVFTVRGKR